VTSDCCFNCFRRFAWPRLIDISMKRRFY